MTDDDEQLIRRWFDEVWNQKSEKAIDEMFDDDGVFVSPIHPSDNPVRGVEAFKSFLESFWQVLFGLEINVEDLVCENDKVTTLCRANFKRHDDRAENVHKEIEITGLCVFRVLNGKITQIWTNLDFLDSGRKYDHLLLRSL